MKASPDAYDKERAAKLAKLCEIEGYADENELFAAAMSDSVCPAICCNAGSAQIG